MDDEALKNSHKRYAAVGGNYTPVTVLAKDVLGDILEANNNTNIKKKK